MRVVALTGVGDAFCAGLDLSAATRSSALSAQADQLDDLSWVGQFLLALRKRCDKPVVGGVKGVRWAQGSVWRLPPTCAWWPRARG